MKNDLLQNLVKDWGGFEKLVAKLHDTGTVRVQHNVILTGKSGTPRQIDVMVKHKEGLYDHLIIIECKHWKKNVSRLHVDALITAIKDLNASKGVIFTAKGFQKGAIRAAAHEGIDLYKVRELTDEEWGLPGRVVDVFLQFFEKSIGNVKICDAMAVGNPTAPIHLNLVLGDPEKESKTPMVKKDGALGRTLEELLSEAATKAYEEFTKDSFLLCDGIECTRYMLGSVNLVPPEPYLVPLNDVVVIIPKITFELGIKIQQSRLVCDRGKNLMFILAVEDCVSESTSLAQRKDGAEHTKISPITRTPPYRDTDDVLKNGSVMKIVLKSHFSFEEMSGLQPVDIEQVRRPRKTTNPPLEPSR